MTGPGPLSTWIEGRDPPVPAAFRPFVRPRAPEAPATPDAWVAEARRALGEMGDDRGARSAAFALLAADGFATWACEAALDDADPEAALRGVLRALLE